MALFFHRLEIGFINSRVKSDEWKKGASSAAASTSIPGSLSLFRLSTAYFLLVLALLFSNGKFEKSLN